MAMGWPSNTEDGADAAGLIFIAWVELGALLAKRINMANTIRGTGVVKEK